MGDRFFEEITLLFSRRSRLFALRSRQSLIDSVHLYGEHKANTLNAFRRHTSPPYRG